MANDKQSAWENEFRDFLDAEATAVPQALSERVMGVIHSRLHPSFGQVLVKLAAVQVAAGAVSLLFCPQFGVSLSDSGGLMQYLMKYGEPVCMMGCGSLFTGLSLLIASFALKPEEVKALREHRLLQLTAVAALSLGAFACVGGEVVAGLGLIWTVGAVLGGMATLELGWSIRRRSYGRNTI